MDGQPEPTSEGSAPDLMDRMASALGGLKDRVLGKTAAAAAGASPAEPRSVATPQDSVAGSLPPALRPFVQPSSNHSGGKLSICIRPLPNTNKNKNPATTPSTTDEAESSRSTTEPAAGEAPAATESNSLGRAS